jgi:hypothetical protein
MVAVRWSSVVLSVAAGAVLVLLGGALLPPKTVSWVGALPPWMFIAFGVLVLGTIVPMAHAGVFGNLGAEKAYVNPPRWLQYLLCLALIGAIWKSRPDTIPSWCRRDIQLFCQRWGFASLCGVILLSCLLTAMPHLTRRIHRNRTPKEEGGRLDLNTADFAALQAWLRTDDEIREFGQDAFDHSRIAKRMAERIAQAAEGKLGRCPTFALVGELGAGKSSVLELVRADLGERQLLDRRVLLVSVSLWPFETPDAAINGILRSLEAEFSKVTSTSSIVNAPDRYLRAIEKVEKRVGLLTELFATESTPEGALEAYSRLATLVGVHVVVWIEDLERFEAGASGESRTTPVRALLHQLQRFERLTVVVASDNLAAQADFHKIAQFVESIPPLEARAAWRVVSRVRRGCQEKFVEGAVVDLVHPFERELTLAEAPFLAFLNSNPRSDRRTDLTGAIVYFCRTPRTLKFSLRAFLDAWDVLLGEIDLDDLLVMCVLRAARPDVFALVDKYSAGLSNRPLKDRSDLQKDDRAFEAELRAITGDDVSSKSAIDTMLGYVFPRWTEPSTEYRPQGISVRWPRDYWRRFLSLARVPPEERDQTILRAIVDWNDRKSTHLSSITCDPRLDRLVEHFGGSITEPRLRDLLEEVVRIQAGESRARRAIESAGLDTTRPPGITALSGLFRRRLETGELDQAALASSLGRTLEIAVPKRLWLAAVLVEEFVNRYRDGRALIEEGAAERLYSELESQLCQFSGQSDRLVDALRGASLQTLWRISWRWDRIRSKQHLAGVPFKGWKAFADVIIDAARRDPFVMLVQIAWFFVSYEEGADPVSNRTVRKMVFNRDVAERLFGIENLAEIFACDDSQMKWVLPEPSVAIRFVRSELTDIARRGGAKSEKPVEAKA